MTVSISLTRWRDWRGKRRWLHTWSAPWGGVARWLAFGSVVLFVRAYK